SDAAWASGAPPASAGSDGTVLGTPDSGYAQPKGPTLDVLRWRSRCASGTRPQREQSAHEDRDDAGHHRPDADPERRGDPGGAPQQVEGALEVAPAQREQ